MAASEIEAGSRLIHRNVAFNTYGFLNTTEKFAREKPEYVRKGASQNLEFKAR